MATLLNYCGTDFANPLAREWALMAVRNACEGHSETQSFIASLQPQEVLEDELMRRLGLSVEIDPARGKFQIRQNK